MADQPVPYVDVTTGVDTSSTNLQGLNGGSCDAIRRVLSSSFDYGCIVHHSPRWLGHPDRIWWALPWWFYQAIGPLTALRRQNLLLWMVNLQNLTLQGPWLVCSSVLGRLLWGDCVHLLRAVAWSVCAGTGVWLFHLLELFIDAVRVATTAVTSRQIMNDVVQFWLLFYDLRLARLAHMLTVALMINFMHHYLGLIVQTLDEIIILLLTLLGPLFALWEGRVLHLHLLRLIVRDICMLLSWALSLLMMIFSRASTRCPNRTSIFVHLLPVAFNLIVSNLRDLF